MKYFTKEWYLACQDFDTPLKAMNRPFKEYRRYFASIKKELPKNFVKFDKRYSLHDATLLKLNLNAEKQRLKIKLMLAIVHEKFIEGRDGAIIYSGVTDFSISKRAETSLEDFDSYRFLIYNEIEVINPAVFEHRILFSSGVEFCIVFTGFDFVIDK